jgi:hypothetical protein
MEWGFQAFLRHGTDPKILISHAVIGIPDRSPQIPLKDAKCDFHLWKTRKTMGINCGPQAQPRSDLGGFSLRQNFIVKFYVFYERGRGHAHALAASGLSQLQG